MEEALYVDVALGVPQAEPYQYSVPAGLAGRVGVGKRVKVPLRNQTRYGYVVGVSPRPLIEGLKDILEVTDETSLIDASFLELTRWMADTYFCSWGQAIEAALPAPFKKGKTTMKTRAPKPGAPERTYLHASPDTHVLTAAQAEATGKITAAVASGRFASFLLYGITGSGKTEVYLRVIEKLLDAGRGAIVLVPEISLTPQTLDRFESRFRGQVAVLHSRLSPGRRLDAWHRLKKGEARVAVGARSALFSPVRNLGLIVIDEEHDDSYKQEETPRYDAWLVARKRCEIENAVLLRGSATPRLESTYEARHGGAELLPLPERIERRPLPVVQIIDMRREFSGRAARVFSIQLESAVKDALANKEQVLFFINRRGFAPYVSCGGCGYVASCPRCRVVLVYHFDRQVLLCHTCSYAAKPPRICPKCSKDYLRYLGIGTEKVESEASRLFPAARIARMDADTTKAKGSHERILDAFRKREIDILLGTQMITKGHDFPGISVIGVVSADTALHMPDFRAAERTFSILTQVAGRAGRDDVPGKVFIQTFVPFHYAVACAKKHDYEEFYSKEIVIREELNFPPFRRLIQVIIGGQNERLVARKSASFRKHTEESGKALLIDVSGPAPCIISKRRGQFLWNLFYKGENVLRMNAFLREKIGDFDSKGVRITVDVDPR